MRRSVSNRWFQLFLAVAVFVIISGPQYLWPLFVRPLLDKLQIPLSRLQVVFSLVVVGMTFITPLAGYFHDRFRSRNILALGLFLSCGSWILAARASSVFSLFFTYGLMGGLGAGISFIGCTGLVQKCFPDRRGLATGILMSGYALGPLLTTGPAARSVDLHGVDRTLSIFGWILLGLSFLIVLGVRDSAQIAVPPAAEQRNFSFGSGVGARVMLKQPVFWLMFLMMSVIATCGMMITSNISVIAKDHGVGGEVIFLGMAALPLALMLDRITNGFSRILFGFISDKWGRENTLAFAFACEALFLYIWQTRLQDPLIFILFSGLVFLAWGEIFSIFPALCTDTFGEKNASVNFGFLYASVGVGAILGGPVAALLREWSGGWSPVFYIVMGLDLCTALLALTALKRMRRLFLARQGQGGSL